MLAPSSNYLTVLTEEVAKHGQHPRFDAHSQREEIEFVPLHTAVENQNFVRIHKEREVNKKEMRMR